MKLLYPIYRIISSKNKLTKSDTANSVFWQTHSEPDLEWFIIVVDDPKLGHLHCLVANSEEITVGPWHSFRPFETIHINRFKRMYECVGLGMSVHEFKLRYPKVVDAATTKSIYAKLYKTLFNIK